VRRRDFIAALGGVPAWPLIVSAQTRKRPTVGLLGATTPEGERQWIAALRQGLHERGWIENQTVTIDYRSARGSSERYAEIAAEFVQLKVDVIVAVGPSAIAAQRATSKIPVVFALAGDPVGVGLVASLARPGANITGLSLQSADLAGKRLELLREVVPGLRRIAVLVNAENQAALRDMDEVQTAARTIGIKTVVFRVRLASDISSTFDALKGAADAIYVPLDPLMFANRIRINTLALGARLPTIYGYREYVVPGGLMSYGANFPDRSGAPPATPTRFCEGRSRPTFRLSNRPSLIWSLT
jgi:putative ABC transport system substrate-binding protein